MKAIRVLLVDDQPAIRRGLVMRLQLEPDITVVGEASDGLTALRLVDETTPDVLVMDYEMPAMDGLTTTRALQAAGNPAGVVMLSIHDSTEVRRGAAEAGVHAFVAKHESGDRLLSAIRSAAASGKEDTS